MAEIDELRELISGARIYVIPYSHSDWAWTCTRQWHEERYAVVFEEVLEIMRGNPEYRWYFDTENEQLAPFRKRRPERMAELRQRVAEGRVGIAGGTITNPHPHRVGGEILIRNLVMGRRYFERDLPGADLSVLTLNDVIYGHSQLPQIAAKCGYRYYWGTRPQCLAERGIPRQFVWQSPDGSRLLCAHGRYGSRLSSRDYADVTWAQGAADFIEEDILPALRESPTRAVWVTRGADDLRPLRDPRDRPLDVAGFVARWREHESVPLRFALPVDYFKDVEREIERLPVVVGPVDPVGWSYWYGQIGNESLRTWRLQTEEQLLTAEKLATVCTTCFGDPYPGALPALWHDLLAACAHATLWLFADDYDEMLSRLKRTHAAARELADGRAQRLGAAATTGGGARLVAVNPEARERRSLLTLHKVCPRRGCRSLRVRDGQGREVAHQILDPVAYEDGSLKEAGLLVEASVPALGCAAFTVEESADGADVWEEEGKLLSVLANERSRLRFKGGKLVQLVSRDTGMEPLASGEYSIGEVRFHVIEDTGPYHYGPVVESLPFECKTATLIEEGPLRSRALLRGRIGPHQVEQRISIYSTTNRIDFEVTIDSAGGDGFFRAYFPFARDGRISVDVPFGVEARDVTAEPYGCLERKRENVFYGSNWADYTDGELGGALLIEPGMQGFCHFPEQRLLGHTLLKTISHPTEGWERSETRLREGKGVQRFRYALLPHPGDWAVGGVDLEAVEFRAPLRAYWGWGPATDQEPGSAAGFLRCSADNASVSSLYMEGETVVLRLVETRGRDIGEVEFTLPFVATGAAKTNCLMEPLDEVVWVEENRLRCALGAWEIATLAIER